MGGGGRLSPCENQMSGDVFWVCSMAWSLLRSPTRRRRRDGVGSMAWSFTKVSTQYFHTQVYPIAAWAFKARPEDERRITGEHGQLRAPLKRPVALRGLVVGLLQAEDRMREFRDAHPEPNLDLQFVGVEGVRLSLISHSPVLRAPSTRPLQGRVLGRDGDAIAVVARPRRARAMFVSARVFRATTSSSKSTVSEGREFALSATSSTERPAPRAPRPARTPCPSRRTTSSPTRLDRNGVRGGRPPRRQYAEPPARNSDAEQSDAAPELADAPTPTDPRRRTSAR